MCTYLLVYLYPCLLVYFIIQHINFIFRFILTHLLIAIFLRASALTANESP